MTSPELSRPRVALTGARGVLGRTLQHACPDIDWLEYAGRVEDVEAVQAWLAASGRVDAVVHLAALVPTHLVEDDPPRAIRTNVGGTANVLEAVRYSAAPRPWTFVASTSHVYASSERPLREDSPIAPVSLYGLTKLQAESWVTAYQARFGLDVCVGRVFSYTSRWQTASYFMPALARRIAQAGRGAELDVRGLLGTRDFLTADHVSTAIRVLLDRRATGIYNIGCGLPTRLLDIATALRDRLGRSDLRFVSLAELTSHLTADVSKLRQLGITLTCTIEELVDEVLAGM